MGSAQEEGISMRSYIRHEINNPVRLVVKVVALTVMLFLFAGAAREQGVQHAIKSARPYVDGTSILIDFDGQVHEYR